MTDNGPNRSCGRLNGIFRGAIEVTALIALHHGDYRTAEPLFEEGLTYARARGDKAVIVVELTNLGLVALYQGRFEQARARFRESLLLSQELGTTLVIAYDLEGLAGVAAGHHAPEQAARLWGAAEALREELGAPPEPEDQVQFQRMIEAARATVDAATWDTAWAAGRAMLLEQAVADALETPPHVG